MECEEKDKLTKETIIKLEEEQKVNNELRDSLEKAKAECEELKKKLENLSKIENPKENNEPNNKDSEELKMKQLKIEELNRKLNEALDDIKRAEDLTIMQVKIEVDGPPDKDSQDKLDEAYIELERNKQKIIELSKTVTEVEFKLKEQNDFINEERNKYELDIKEKTLELDSLKNKLKESNLDLIKANSTIDRKTIEIGKLKNMIKQHEIQKTDLINMVNLRIII